MRLLRTGIETLGLAHRLHWLEKGGIGIPELITTTDDPENSLDIFNDILNPGNELCGAAIRADAYGYAFLGNPAKAAELA